METRRSFLKNSALALTGAFGASSILSSCGESAASSTAAPKSKEFIGLQTYSLSNEFSDDVPGSLKTVREAGYTDIELASYGKGKIAGYSVDDFKKICDDLGLKITSTHVRQPTQYQTPEAEFTEEWKQLCEDHAKMGCKWVIDPSMPQVPDVETAKVIGDRFNLAGKICKEHGLQFGYHNHSGEFDKVASPAEIAEAREKVIAQLKQRNPNGEISEEQIKRMMSNPMFGQAPGTTIEELFMQNTDPELVCFELDCYWAMRGAQDPCEWLRKYPNRFKLLHVKDVWIIGDSGCMNWENIFNTAKSIGIHDWFVELERAAAANGRSQTEGVVESAKYLLAKDFVW